MLKNAFYFNSCEIKWKNARKGLVHACKFPQDTFSVEGLLFLGCPSRLVNPQAPRQVLALVDVLEGAVAGGLVVCGLEGFGVVWVA
jgi:methyl coenzyme M reductase subunit C